MRALRDQQQLVVLKQKREGDLDAWKKRQEAEYGCRVERIGGRLRHALLERIR